MGLAAVERQTPDLTTSHRWSRRRVVEESASGTLMTLAEATTPSLTVRLIRPADQLDLLLELLDVSLDPVTNQLEGVLGGDPRLRVILGAQHTTEDTLADVDVVAPPLTPLISRTAGASRLVAGIQTPLAFTVDALLDTAAWVLRSPAGAGTPLRRPHRAGAAVGSAAGPRCADVGDDHRAAPHRERCDRAVAG